jgi:cobalamin biosynthesis Mg chelatase CobN
VSPRLSRLLPALVAACAAAAVVSAPAPAATPCWKLLLNDWYDGKIDHVYPIHCYHDAIKHLPTDIKVYSSAADDINRALRQALDAKKAAGSNGGQTTTTSSSNTTPAPTTTRAKPTKTTTHSHTTSTAVPPTTVRKKPPGGLTGALRNSSPGGADSFPLPLLILGIIAVVLVLAGVGGMLWRRYHGPGATP